MYFRKKIKEFLLLTCNIAAFITMRQVNPVILMYHSFDTQNWKHGVSSEDIEEQIIYLKKKREIVSLSEVVAYAKAEKEVSRNAVSITVDDGYEDTYTVLFPLAKKYNIPFTLFLTTDLSQQEKLGNLPRPTWEELKEMSDSSLVDIQVHGHSHINFPGVLERNIENFEIENSKQLISEKLGVLPTMVAYPAGNYNDQVLDYVATNGYRAGLSTHMGTVVKGDNPFLLRRVVVDRDTSLVLFKLRLSSGLGLYSKLVQKIKKIYV